MLFVWAFIAGVACTPAGLFIDIITDEDEGNSSPRGR